MTEISEKQLRTIKIIVKNVLEGKFIAAENLTDGYAGYVYDVKVRKDTREVHYAVKLIPFKVEPSINKETIDNRVYGTRLSNFIGAYKLLKQHLFKIPIFYAYGNPTSKIPYVYHVMSVLKGVSVRSFLAHKKGEKMQELHRVVGKEFGKLHAITRSYDGYADQTVAFTQDWKSVFFQALNRRFQKVIELNANLKIKAFQIEKAILKKEEEWVDPSEFVFSDIDGFQGMAAYEKGAWLLTGIIDIEDHKFIDQRMALAGYELSLEYEGRLAPHEFWEGYKTNKTIPPAYHALKNIFQLYYLLSWLPMIYEDDWRGKEEERLGVIKRFEDLILERIK